MKPAGAPQTSSQLSAADLRREFDAAFAQPLAPIAAETEELLAIHAGGSAYALRVREVSGVFLRTPVVPIPSAHPALLGLAGVRGAIVPVYSLAVLLGHPPSPEAPRWLAVCAGPLPIALGFDALDGHLRLTSEQLRQVGDQPLAAHVHQVASSSDGARAVVDLASVIKAIKDRGGSP